MSNGRSFLQERVIYEYLEYRVKQDKLFLLKVFDNGKRVLNKKFYKVKTIKPIETSFPDINEMIFEDSKVVRPGEVKFLTSSFDYHKVPEYEGEFSEFMNDNGCIIVLKHDLLPSGLIDNYKVDIFEIDIEDFRAFVIENFNRLLQKQLQNREKDYEKIWVSSQTLNFYRQYKTYPVNSAKVSGIWCPTNNLTSFDLARGDKILFIKFGGEFQIKQSVNNYWKEHNSIYPKWMLQSIYIGKITNPIMSREEYCDIHGINLNEPLWNDEYKSGKIKWRRVFCFEKEKEILIHNGSGLSLAHANKELGDLIYPIFFDVYTQQNTREITPNQYFSLLEYISGEISEELNTAQLLKDRISQLIINTKQRDLDVSTLNLLENEFNYIENNYLN